jgi:hypothetical protein
MEGNMIGTDLINKIKEIGEEREILIRIQGACEGIMCYKEIKVDNICLYQEIITLDADVDTE